MNYYEAAEKILLSVPLLEKSLENLYRRSGEISEDVTINAKQTINACKNESEINRFLDAAILPHETERNITATEKKLEEIKHIVQQLDNEQAEFIKLKYFEQRRNEYILTALHYESFTTLYKIRRRAVGNFALLYFGASALPSVSV